MNRKAYFLCNIEKESWEKLFLYFINKGDNYKVYLPLEVSGVLDNASKEAIIEHVKLCYLEDNGELWSLKICLGEEKLLYIGNFNDRFIYLDKDDFKFVKKENIDTKDWIEVDIKSEEDCEREEIKIASFTDEELKIMKDTLGKEVNNLND